MRDSHVPQGVANHLPWIEASAFDDLPGLLDQHELIAHLSRRPVAALNDVRKQRVTYTPISKSEDFETFDLITFRDGKIVYSFQTTDTAGLSALVAA